MSLPLLHLSKNSSQKKGSLTTPVAALNVGLYEDKTEITLAALDAGQEKCSPQFV